MWIDPVMMETLVNAVFGIFEVRPGGLVISLRTQGLQRLVATSIATRSVPIVPIQIPILIRFKLSEPDLPRPPRIPTITENPVESSRSTDRSGPPSNVSEAELLDQVSELPSGSSPVLQIRGSITTATATGNNPADNVDVNQGSRSVPGMHTTFRGIPVDVHRNVPLDPGPTISGRRDYDSYGPTGDDIIVRNARGDSFHHWRWELIVQWWQIWLGMSENTGGQTNRGERRRRQTTIADTQTTQTPKERLSTELQFPTSQNIATARAEDTI